MESTKLCRKCQVVKETTTQFEKDRKRKDGSYQYKPECKDCRKGCRVQDQAAYQQTHREELNLNKYVWRILNK
jgi:hypothetical protein